MRDVTAVENDRAVARARIAADGHHQRRLAGAVGADQRHDLALADLNVDAFECGDGAVVGVHATDGEEGGHGPLAPALLACCRTRCALLRPLPLRERAASAAQRVRDWVRGSLRRKPFVTRKLFTKQPPHPNRMCGQAGVALSREGRGHSNQDRSRCAGWKILSHIPTSASTALTSSSSTPR